MNSKDKPSLKEGVGGVSASTDMRDSFVSTVPEVFVENACVDQELMTERQKSSTFVMIIYAVLDVDILLDPLGVYEVPQCVPWFFGQGGSPAE